jgi:hypothetical protein
VKNIRIITFLTSAFVFLTVSFAHAAYVEKVKGKKALLFLDNMNVEKGDLVYTVDAGSGKKTSILRITTVKDQKAIGELVKGKVKAAQEIVPKNGARPAKSASHSGGESAPSRSRSSHRANSQFAIGGFVGMNFDKMDFVESDGLTYKGSGSGIGVTGALDYNISSLLGLRGMIGVDQFKADADPAYTTKITYVTSMLWGRLNFLQETTKAWVGAGFGIWFPMSKSTNALDTSTIATTAAYALGGGVDMGFSDTLYIPVQLEYGFLPKSDQVKTSYYSIRVGLMLKY